MTIIESNDKLDMNKKAWKSDAKYSSKQNKSPFYLDGDNQVGYAVFGKGSNHMYYDLQDSEWAQKSMENLWVKMQDDFGIQESSSSKKPIIRKINEAVSNEKVSELIAILKNENFGNENQRKRFVDIVSSLMNLQDVDARVFFKKLGQACTSIGNEMLDDIVPEVEEGYPELGEEPIEDDEYPEVEMDNDGLDSYEYESDFWN